MMDVQSTTIQKLIGILDTLDAFIHDYPVFIYLIDRNYHLVWYNQYLVKQIPNVKGAKHQPCYEILWGKDEMCGDCSTFEHIEQKQVSRDVIQRKLPDKNSDVYLEIISLPVVNNEREIEAILRIGFDVTTLELEQRALRDKEKLFTSMIDTSADAIFFLDNQEKFLSWNKGAEDLFGYTEDEVLGKSSILLIPNELVELGELFYINQELEKKGFLRRYETQRLHKDGRVLYVDVTRTSIKNEQNEVIGTSVIIKDITSRVRLEFELRRTVMELSKLNELNEILYTTYILDDILQMILIAVTAGEGLRFNRAFLLMIDEEQQNLRGELAIGPANEAEAHRIWSSLQDHLRSLKDIVQHFQINLQGEDHTINELVKKINVPLTQHQNILIKSIRERRTFYVQSGEVEGTTKSDNNFDYGNLPDVLGTDTFVVCPLSTKKEPIGVIIADNQITRRDIVQEEIESLKLFANQASMAIENARLYKNLEDRIEELQEAYRKLEDHSQRLVKAERLAAIGELSAKVAHEIRNPLVSIGGFARLLGKKIPENSTLQKYVGIIGSQVSHLESILDNILTIAKPTTSKHHKVDIHQIIQNVLSMMDEVLSKREVDVSLQFRCRDSLVKGDEKLLFQVLLNLIKNALESMHENYLLSIKTACRKQMVSIQIEDRGTGMTSEQLDKIYEPFFTTKKEGTGLGLAVVKQIVEDHQGSINIKSEPGFGTTVTLSIPRFLNEEVVQQGA